MDTCKGKHCPLIRKKCIEHKCAFFQHMIGANPQTGAQFDTWDCTHRWTPLLLIENSQQQRQTAAAIESLRNVNFEGGQGLVAALLAGASQPRHNSLLEQPHEQRVIDSGGGSSDSRRTTAVGSEPLHPDGGKDQTDPERRGDSRGGSVAGHPTS